MIPSVTTHTVESSRRDPATSADHQIRLTDRRAEYARSGRRRARHLRGKVAEMVSHVDGHEESWESRQCSSKHLRVEGMREVELSNAC